MRLTISSQEIIVDALDIQFDRYLEKIKQLSVSSHSRGNVSILLFNKVSSWVLSEVSKQVNSLEKKNARLDS